VRRKYPRTNAEEPALKRFLDQRMAFMTLLSEA
jgi:hypothetical protein